MTPAFHDNEGPPPVGYFTYSLVGDHWSWSDGMYRLHGVQRDHVTPSTALLLAHLHPDDRAGVYEVLDNAMRAATPFTCYHRVIDGEGQEHSVLLVGRGVRDDRGLVERLEGYVVDIAPNPSPVPQSG
jgi:PAS domain-containing protein